MCRPSRSWTQQKQHRKGRCRSAAASDTVQGLFCWWGQVMTNGDFTSQICSCRLPSVAWVQVTANHYFTDALAGAAVVGVAYFAAMRTPEFGRGATADWGPALHWLTGAESSPAGLLGVVVTWATRSSGRSIGHHLKGVWVSDAVLISGHAQQLMVPPLPGLCTTDSS
jgi:hypothetical protein